MHNQRGFSLIELITVILLLGIMSVVALPKFVDIQEDAQESSVKAISAAFNAGIEQVHIAWLIRGNGQAVQNFIDVSDPVNGEISLSVNSFGYPADSRGTSLTTNSTNDCLDVWRAVVEGVSVDQDDDDNAQFIGNYLGSNQCNYQYAENTDYNIVYDSNTGEVTLN